MRNFAKGVGTIVFGNFLTRNSQQPAAQSSPAKRPSDSTLTQTSKRPRNDDGRRTAEVISVDGTYDTLEMDRSSDSTGKRKTNHQGSQSLRSSENRHPSSGAIDEYRSASSHAGLYVSRTRSRHQKKRQLPPNGVLEQELDKPSSHETATQPYFKKPGRPLISQSEQANDRIEDDGLQLISGGARSGPATGHGNMPYKKSVFALIPNEASSDDELNQVAPPPSKPKLRDGMYPSTRPKERRGNQSNNGLKRTAGSPDVLQGEHPAKRRNGPSSEADILRTKFPARMGSTRCRPGAFRVRKAVCEPKFIYPAPDNMPDDFNGASNTPCFLSPNGRAPHHFIVTDDDGAELEALRWIMPNLAKIRRIDYQNGSPILKINSATGFDSNAGFSKGAATLIEFDSFQEAHNWAITCQDANTSIELQPYVGSDMRATMDERTKQIRDRHKQKQPTPLPPDMQVAARQAETRQSTRQRVNAPILPEARPSAQSKMLRAHMRADDDPSTDALEVTEQEQNGELWGQDNNQTEQAKHSSRRSQEPQRNLRSVKPKVRSPTPPPPERWTEQNPNWVEERGYKIPLIYERTTISATDIERLDEGQFLNDEIISFYAKYLHKRLEARNEQVAKKVYVFSSFFWEKLRSSGYDGVRGWTTKVDVSSFDYIVVPINQSAHWYLAIICNPGALLPKEDTGQDADAVHLASAGEKDQDQVSVEGEASNKMETVTSSLAHISFDEQQLDGAAAINLETPKPTSSAKKSKPAKRGSGPRKYHPKDPRVIVLDSLDGAHTNVATTLKTYLRNEIKQRKNVDIELPQQFGMAAKDIPFQTNFTDCGVYLLGYLEEFMKDPHEFTKKILQHESRDWDVNASAMRSRIRELIFDLQNEYCKELRRQKREKRAASQQKKAKSQTPPAAPQASSPRFASEQSVQRPYVISSSTAKSRQPSPAHALSSPTVQVDAAQKVGQRSATISPPPLQRKQASSRQAVVKPSSFIPSSQSPERDPQAADVNDRTIDEIFQSEESKKSAPMQQGQTSSNQAVTKKKPALSSDSGSEVVNADASMVVHLSQSMESIETRPSQPEQIVSSQAVTKPGRVIKSSPPPASRSETADAPSKIGRPLTSSKVKGTQSAAEPDNIPGPSQPVEPVDVDKKTESNPSKSSESPTPHGASRLPEPPTMLDGNYDEKSFMAPIPSSPSSASPVSPSASSRSASKGRTDRSEASSIKKIAEHSTSRPNGERSHYWPPPAKAPVRKDKGSRQMEAPSSDDGSMARGGTTRKEEDKRRNKTHKERRRLPETKDQEDDKRKTTRPTIDLTAD
ncbi:hypothetical protein N0V82_000099 [Gnomoniopsis sp. IMI 355080]|nr:hypothetical protein N0V82_000099 [Gnomoniopsis sp. IMI 355080]